jgi:hypothetical protein
MEWIIKIEEKKDQRILVRYLPGENGVIFIGQYRYAMNWVDFVTSEIIAPNRIIYFKETETILFYVATMLESKVIELEKLKQIFKTIELIEVPKFNILEK